jgi:hypothetical protein
MRKLFCLIVLLLCSQAWGTITVVQSHVDTSQVSCSAGACAGMTVTSTGSGHTGVVAVTTDVTGDQISTITCNVSCPNWTTSHSSPVCAGSDTAGSASTDIAYYNGTLPSGVTTITVTLTSATTASSVDRAFIELSFTGSSLVFDTCGNRTNTPASANYAGVALTLTGTNDYIFQVGRPSTGITACSAGWTSPNTFVAGDAYCGKNNTNAGTAVTYTVTSSTGALSALAMKETSAGGGTFPPQVFIIHP